MLDVLLILLFGIANLTLGFCLNLALREIQRRRTERNKTPSPIAEKVLSIVNEVDQATLEHSESCTDLKRLLVYQGEPSEGEIRTHGNSSRCYGRLLNSFRSQLAELDPDNQLVTQKFTEELSQAQANANELTGELKGFGSNSGSDTVNLLLDRLQKLESSNHTLRGELQTANEKIQKSMSRLEFAEADARIDVLTRLPNRRAFEERYAELEKGLKIHGRTFCLLLIDLDHFKRVNDTHGHNAGDAVLRVTASLIQDAVRGGDFVARYGGEEFVVLTPGAKLSSARYVAERIREKIANGTVMYNGIALQVTCSIGVSEASEECLGTRLQNTADKLLYAAKDAGRNKVHASPQPVGAS